MTSIKKGDTVYVRAGDQKGKTGRVLHVDRKHNKILVEGVNVRKRHQRPTQKNPKGGILTVEAPIDISNVALTVQTDEGTRPTRVKKKTISDAGGKKTRIRVSRLTGEEI
ncbi:50S ribosomal protein L24 [candidate division GN15 bacterium]|nr:50S ribosomal protein L24 [candidate division GN15 bacterium]